MCFSLQWLEQVFIWIIIICAIVAIVRLLLPMVFAQLGAPGGTILAIINIAMWAIVAIFVVMFAFELISCLLSAGGGLHFPSIRR
jgi:hypothetical protein